jgi:hypothetical protein
VTTRTILRAALLLLVAGSLGAWIVRRSEVSAEVPADAAAPTAVAGAKVVVTYFTTDVRCTSCRKIEELSRRAVEEGFPAALADGSVVFRVINTDRNEHKHFVDHYSITNKIVIVSHQRSGREVDWEPCQDVWLLLDDPEEFFAYVRQPIHDYLGRK